MPNVQVIQASFAPGRVRGTGPTNVRLSQGGHPLPPDLLARMNQSFRANFGRVRVQTSPEPVKIGALAFTAGEQIYFAPGQYCPNDPHTARLLAHELTHVLQQRGGRVQCAGFASGTVLVQDPALEAEAERRAALLAPVPPVAARVAIQPSPRKTILNILSLGIRRAYVTNKRKKRARQQQQVLVADPPAPKTMMDRHVEAYDSAVYHHSTHHQNEGRIREHGLLIYEDRVRIFGEDVAGMSSIGGVFGEFAGDEKLGVFLGPRNFALESAETLPKLKVRAALRREEKASLSPDRRFPGGKIIRTSVARQAVWTGKTTDLGEEQLGEICAIIREHYDDPKPTVQEVIETHLQAVRTRRLSDAALEPRQ